MKVYILIFTLAALSCLSQALKCYDCRTTLDECRKNPVLVTCPSDYDRCFIFSEIIYYDKCAKIFNCNYEQVKSNLTCCSTDGCNILPGTIIEDSTILPSSNPITEATTLITVNTNTTSANSLTNISIITKPSRGKKRTSSAARTKPNLTTINFITKSSIGQIRSGSMARTKPNLSTLMTLFGYAFFVF